MGITITAGIVAEVDGEEIVDTTQTAGCPSLDVNVRNGVTLLSLLGVPADLEGGEWGGEWGAEDFLGRVLLAQALVDGAADDQHGLPAHTDGRWHDGGRRPGYLADRLAQLRHLAEWARERGAVVCWH